MASRPHLGRVTAESLKKLSKRISEKTLKPSTHGMSYLEDYEKGRDARVRAYGYLNALGYEYGFALAEAFLSDFLKADDPDQAAAYAEVAARDIRSWLVEVMARAQPMDVHLVREAVREVGDRMPRGDSPEEMIQAGMTYSNGMYIRDFSYSVASALQQAMWDLEKYMVWHKTPYSVSFDPVENAYVPDMFQEPSREQLKAAVKAANEEIRHRTYYGMRNVKLPDHPNFTILGWSNGSESWHIAYGMQEPLVQEAMLRGGGTVGLDANYILVPVHPFVMAKVVDELEPLPLFDYSLEAKIRGRYPHADDRTVRKVLRAIIDAEMPDEDVEERAVLAIDMWEIFKKAKLGIPGADGGVEIFVRSLKQPMMPYLKILTDWLDR